MLSDGSPVVEVRNPFIYLPFHIATKTPRDSVPLVLRRFHVPQNRRRWQIRLQPRKRSLLYAPLPTEEAK